MDHMDLQTLPVDKLYQAFLNANRDPGNEKEGRQPAPPISLWDVRTVRRGKRRVNADEAVPGGKHNLYGAKAVKADWKAFSEGRRIKKRIRRK